MPNNMKQKILVLVIFFSIWSIRLLGQPEKQKEYGYDLCVYYNEKDKPSLLTNETLGIADTILALVYGKVFDFESNPLAYANIKFENYIDTIKRGCTSDSLGNYRIYLPSGDFKLTMSFVGFSDFVLNGLKLGSGEIKQIIAKLGSGSGYRNYRIESDKPLSEKQLNRLERKLKKKN